MPFSLYGIISPLTEPLLRTKWVDVKLIFIFHSLEESRNLNLILKRFHSKRLPVFYQVSATNRAVAEWGCIASKLIYNLV